MRKQIYEKIRYLLCIILILASVVLLIALVIISETPRARYVHYPCNYDVNFTDFEDYFAVALGGSRLKTAFDAKEINKTVQNFYTMSEERPAPSINVANISHNRRGMDIEYILARDFLKRHKVDVFIILYDAKQALKPHDTFPQTASWVDFPHLLFADKEKNLIHRISSIFQSVLYRITTISFYETKKQTYKKSAGFIDCHLRDIPLNLERLEHQTPIDINAGLRWSNNDNQKIFADDYQEYFLKQISKLTEIHDVKFLFLEIPFRGRKTFDEKQASLMTKKYGLKFLSIPDKILHEIQEEGYRDGTHFYEKGRKIFTPWLAKEIYSFAKTDE